MTKIIPIMLCILYHNKKRNNSFIYMPKFKIKKKKPSRTPKTLHEATGQPPGTPSDEEEVAREAEGKQTQRKLSSASSPALPGTQPLPHLWGPQAHLVWSWHSGPEPGQGRDVPAQEEGLTRGEASRLHTGPLRAEAAPEPGARAPRTPPVPRPPCPLTSRGITGRDPAVWWQEPLPARDRATH